MPGRRRAEGRANAQATAVGVSIREARLVTGLTRQSAASRAGVARSTWNRIEHGDPSATLRNVVAAADAVGLDLVCQTYPGRPLSLRDSGQLGIATWLRELARGSRRITLEERAGEHGEAIDMVLWGPTEIIAVEIERTLANWQSQLRRWSSKRAWLSSRHARPVRLVIVVSDTEHNRAVIAPFMPLIRETLPAGTRTVLHAFTAGTALERDGLCWIRERRPPKRR